MYWISQFGMTVKPRICVSFVPSQGLRQSSDAHSSALAHAVSEQKAEKPGEQSQLRLAVFGSLEEPGWFGRWIRRDWWIASHRFTTFFFVVIVEGVRGWPNSLVIFSGLVWVLSPFYECQSMSRKVGDETHYLSYRALAKFQKAEIDPSWMGLRWPTHEPRNVTIDFVCGGVAFFFAISHPYTGNGVGLAEKQRSWKMDFLPVFQVKVWSQHRAAMLWPWDFVKLSLFQIWLERWTRGRGGGGCPTYISPQKRWLHGREYC